MITKTDLHAMDLETLAENEWNEKWFRVMSKIENVNWTKLSYNPNTPIGVILNHPEVSWDWQGVGNNLQLTMQIVLDNLNKNWSWWSVTDNPNITSNDILRNMNLPWKWNNLIYRKKLTIEMILANPNYSWDWKAIYEYECIPLKTMMRYSQFPWNAMLEHKYAILEHKYAILEHKYAILEHKYAIWQHKNAIYLRNKNYDSDEECINKRYKNDIMIVMKREKLIFIEHQTMLAILITLFDFYQQPSIRCSPIPFSNIERIFLDEYLMQLIVKN
jgi:hypothetical protein